MLQEKRFIVRDATGRYCDLNSTMIPASTTSKHPQFPIPRFEILDILVFESTSIAGICNASSSSLIFGDKSSPHSNGLCEREY